MNVTNPPPEWSKSIGAVAATTVITNGEFVGFDQLAGFPMPLTDELEVAPSNHAAEADRKVAAMIPGNIKACDGKDIAVDGFMMPTVYDGDKVSEFVLTRGQPGCCYADIPQIHELIHVRVTGRMAGADMDSVVRVRGTLHVGVQRENGQLSGVYTMDADTVHKAPDK